MGPGDSTTWHPSAEQVSAFLDGTLAREERAKLMDHLVVCAECRREIADASRLVRSARPGRRSYVAAFGVLAAAAVTFVLVARFPSRQPIVPGESSQRTVEPDVVAPITVVTPGDGAVSRGALALIWRPDAPSALYRITLQDSTGSVRWSTSTTDTSAVVPDSVRLSPGATYYWSVDALRPDGRSTTSRAHWFIR